MKFQFFPRLTLATNSRRVELKRDFSSLSISQLPIREKREKAGVVKEMRIPRKLWLPDYFSTFQAELSKYLKRSLWKAKETVNSKIICSGTSAFQSLFLFEFVKTFFWRLYYLGCYPFHIYKKLSCNISFILILINWSYNIYTIKWKLNILKSSSKIRWKLLQLLQKKLWSYHLGCQVLCCYHFFSIEILYIAVIFIFWCFRITAII